MQNMEIIYQNRLEYERDILSRINITLPPASSKARDLFQVYRAVEDAERIHMNDFIPKAFKNPFSPRIQYTEGECGISLFSELSNIETMLAAYRGKQRQIAVGDLFSCWGQCEDFDSKNHTNYWKYLDVEYECLVKSFNKA